MRSEQKRAGAQKTREREKRQEREREKEEEKKKKGVLRFCQLCDVPGGSTGHTASLYRSDDSVFCLRVHCTFRD